MEAAQKQQRAFETALNSKAPNMDLATALLWTLRILLPIVLFCVYFKLQAPKNASGVKGPTGNVHNRAALLAHREATVGKPAPTSMENIAMKGPAEAPHLFAGGREKRGRGGRDKDESRARGPREKTKEAVPSQTGAEELASSSKQEDLMASALEERMHLESLVNYVAFNRTEQQRTFLPVLGGVPPPPPPPKKQQDESSGALPGPTSDKANADAKLVLRGALSIKRSDPAIYLHDQLSKASVEISESTFEMMIEVCLAAEDLKGASQFLMKMESGGHLPRSALLDKVMNLYSEARTAREKEELAKADALQLEIPLELCEAVVLGEDAGARSKLSSTAPCFVPSCVLDTPQDETSPQPSPATPRKVDTPDTSEKDSPKPPSPAPAFSAGPGSQRTKLTAKSASFVPEFKVVFVPGASMFPNYPPQESSPLPHGGLPPGPVNMGAKGSGFDGFEMMKGSGFEKGGFEKGFDGKGPGFEKGFDGKGPGFEKGFDSKGSGKGHNFENGFGKGEFSDKGFEKGQSGDSLEKGFEKGKKGSYLDYLKESGSAKGEGLVKGKDKGKEKGEKGKDKGKGSDGKGKGKGKDDEHGKDKGKDDEHGKGKGKGKDGEHGNGKGKDEEHPEDWEDPQNWDEAHCYEQGKGWEDSKEHSNGWGEAKGKRWSNDDWSYDNSWSKDTRWWKEEKWFPSANWDFDKTWKESSTKKVWREKKADEPDVEPTESNGNWNEGSRWASAKTWKPKAESVAKAEVKTEGEIESKKPIPTPERTEADNEEAE